MAILRRKLAAAKITAIASVIPLLIYAHEYGPDPGYTGAPGDNKTACIAAGCHVGTVNSGKGSVTIQLPGTNTYTPGATQHITVTLTDPSAHVWGFQMTARLASNPSSAQAGDFNPTDSNTQVLCQDGRAKPCSSRFPIEYVEQTLASSHYDNPVSGPMTWSFDWTPPSSAAGDVIFYVAGNAGVAPPGPSNTFVYTSTLTLSAAAAMPVPSVTGVVNGASFQPAISPNSYFTVTGDNLATNTRQWTAAEVANGLPTSLDGTSITVNGKPAYIFFISPKQVNAITPADSSSGAVSVVVTVNNQSSAPATAQLQPLAPAFFAFSPGTADNGKYAAATHADGSDLGKAGLFPSAPNLTTPAAAGETIVLYGTGFGPTNPAVPSGQATAKNSPVTLLPTVIIGGQPATVSFAGLLAPYAELYQINVQVPPTAASGDAKLVATINGVISPDVFITIK